MSFTTASQNQPMSSTERRLSSSIDSMPWVRMRRVTLAFSTYSGVGRQITGWAGSVTVADSMCAVKGCRHAA
jgi:hypothetical protein